MPCGVAKKYFFNLKKKNMKILCGNVGERIFKKQKNLIQARKIELNVNFKVSVYIYYKQLSERLYSTSVNYQHTLKLYPSLARYPQVHWFLVVLSKLCPLRLNLHAS